MRSARIVRRMRAAAVVVFFLAQVAHATTTGALTTLLSLPDCLLPSPVIQASDGYLYGTCSQGGAGRSSGYVFRISLRGGAPLLYIFNGTSEGGAPISGLIEGNDEYLYGTNTTGGAGGNGVLYQLTLGFTAVKDGLKILHPALTVLHSFAAADGANAGSLIQNGEGDFFGTAQKGGASGFGTIFEWSHTAAFSVLHSFTGVRGEGTQPNSPLVQASDGLIYGDTQSGGPTASPGTVFRFAPGDGRVPIGGQPVLEILDTIAAFPIPNPDLNLQSPYFFPSFGMTEGADGILYGLTGWGISATVPGSGFGSIYKVTTGSAPTLQPTYYVGFNQNFDPSGTGGDPYSGLTIGGDGNLYGTTNAYGPGNVNPANLNGTVFQFTPAGILTSLVTFIGPAGTGQPSGAPIEASDGNLYGSADHEIYKVVLTPAIPPGMIITATPATVVLGQPVTLNWSVNNVHSQSAQNCQAHGAWSGGQPLTGSLSVTPSAAGNATFALTCGGVESAFASVTVTQ